MGLRIILIKKFLQLIHNQQQQQIPDLGFLQYLGQLTNKT